MNQYLLGRVKNSLNRQSYTMNNSWLTDCIEYYLNDHENPAQDEIITFVINQWLLCDLKEISNENGSLPNNLAKQKCTTLPGKYILQMNKMYDISTSKYKQLEKIRNVSSENIEATENENAAQEDKFQNWEPKSKRMLQLYLTDGVQDILAIEYKPIKFLKDSLFPGFKLMIKGPVVCRKGVILLEEANITEVGGEVDSLLISNAVENVFARALKLEENPDPYNDNNKKIEGSQSVQKTFAIEDDFDMDSEVIDQIEKQIQRQNSSVDKNLNTPIRRDEQILESRYNTSNSQKQPVFPTNKDPNLTSLIPKKSNSRDEFNIQNEVDHFEDLDTIAEMFDDKAFENFSTSKQICAEQSTSLAKKKSSSLQLIHNQHESDFPIENEVYDLTEESSSFFQTQKSKNEPLKLQNLLNKSATSQDINNKKTSCKSDESKQQVTSSKNTLKNNPSIRDKNNINLSWTLPSPLKSMTNVKPSVSNFTDIPDDDFETDDFYLKTDNLNDYFYKNSKTRTNSQTSSKASNDLSKSNNEKLHRSHILFTNLENSADSSSENKFQECDSFQRIENEFGDDFDINFKNNMDADDTLSINQHEMKNIEKHKNEKIQALTIASEKEIDDNSTAESSRTKRLSSVSPDSDVPQKVRRLHNSPKINDTNNEKMTDVLSPTASLESHMPRICELLCSVLKQPLTDNVTQTVIRGKVTRIVKLNLLKGENGSYFYLEGTVTDYTASLEIIFSSKVLENIIGYTAQEFSLKRRQSKTNSAIKDQLREDLKKAQQTLRVMDAFMEIELRKNKKTVILNIMEMNEKQKVFMDFRVQMLKE